MIFSWFFYAICHFHDIDYHFYDFSQKTSGIASEKEEFCVKRKTARSNLAISAACETEGRNARLLRASGNVQQAFLIRLL